MIAKRALALVPVVALALAGCGGTSGGSSGGAATSGSGTTNDSNCGAADQFCIGLVTDLGKIDDKSFNQAAWEGAQAGAKATGGFAKYLESNDASQYATNIQQFLDKKYDVIITVGFNLADATTKSAPANPTVKFIGVDQAQTKTIDNLTGLVFPEDQAGYAVGYLAGLLTKTNKIGQVLGMEIPPVQRYAMGYENGAKAANPKVQVVTVYHPAGDNAFADPVWGANEAQKQLAQGADVIFGAGGVTGNGALGAVAKAPGAGKSVFCIGVDVDQWNTVPEAHPCLVTSAEKLISAGTAELVQQAKDGTIKGGDWTGKAGIAPYHDFASVVPQDVQSQVADVVSKLAAGTLSTGVNLG